MTDPASPVGVADSNVKNAESILDPVLGVAPDEAAVKTAARPKHAALSLIPVVLQEAALKPYLAPKGVDPLALLQELALLQSLMVVAHDADSLKKRVDRTVRVRMGKLWDAVSGILAVAEHTPGDTQAKELAARMQQALALGPRKAKAVKVKLEHPSPKGKAAEKILAEQALQAQQAAHSSSEAPVTPAPSEANGGASPSGSTPNAKG